ncbi:MAG: hypothetical protein H7Y88_10690 [Phycisphaerales bacterium]|nr:hypothetical protein [Phycisphaerales bacterium]
MLKNTTLKRTVNALLAGLAAATFGLATVQSSAAYGQPATEKPKAEKKAEPTLDTIIFKSGRSVKGYILSETDSVLKVKVVGAGGLSVETTYNKSDVLTIEKAKPADPAADPKADPKTDPATGAGSDKPAKGAAGAISSDTTVIYLAKLEGEFGHDVSATPMRKVMEDAKKLKPDIIVLKIDATYGQHGDEIPDFWTIGTDNYGQLDTARQIQTILTDDMRDDDEFLTRDGKKPRLVMWVKKALGGVAFLPFTAPDIYYTSDSWHGGIGYLELMFKGMGDEVVRQKMFSLLLGRAEGLAIKGGHDPKIVRAMSRADYVLSVTFEGGKPVYYEDMSGEHLLTDDASEEGGRRDNIQDVARYKGNDVLTLDSEWAYKLGLSSGTADKNEDLAFLLGVARNYSFIENRSERILKDWSEGVTQAERDFQRLWREFARIPLGNDYDERTRGRGQRIQILQEIKSLLERYKEAINPRVIRNAPENWQTELNIMINRLKQEQRLDKK